MTRTRNLLALAMITLTASLGSASLVYTPKNFNPPSARLLVVIHGCLQSAESMALGSGLNQLADQKNWAVLYPQVPEGTHPLGCWGWYSADNQKADSGQLKMLMDEIRSVKSNLKLGIPKIFLAGISSGGATVAGLMACFPGEIEAAAVHSAPSYGLATSQSEADKVLRDGPPNSPPKGPCVPGNYRGSVLVLQGNIDTVVNPSNAERVIMDFTGMNNPTSVQEVLETDKSYQIADYVQKGVLKGRLVKINGLGHAWSGYTDNLRFAPIVGPQSQFPTNVPFFSAKGPSSTNLISDFFEKKSPPVSGTAVQSGK